MKAKPIIFSGAMVRAILEGRKTQTRRIVKPQPDGGLSCFGWELPKYERVAFGSGTRIHSLHKSPYQPGDLLWVREKFAHGWHYAQPNYLYAATDSVGNSPDFDGWKPSIHMPREASRITLEVTAVRCERLQDISEADAIAEGVESLSGGYVDYQFNYQKENSVSVFYNPSGSFLSLWQSIHGPDSWNANPWVWVYEFRRVKP